MKKTTVTISYDEAQLSALKLYLEQKNTDVESELGRALDTLYQKMVPAGVREFIGMRSGNVQQAPVPRQRKPKSAASPDVEPAVQEAPL